MRLFVLALLWLGTAVPAFAQSYPANGIQWRPPEDRVAGSPIWGYDANGDIACPSDDGVECLFTRDMKVARSAGQIASCGERMLRLQGDPGYDRQGHWCRELALLHGNAAGAKWRAPSGGAMFPWRRNPATGNIECAAEGPVCVVTLERAYRSTQVVACEEADYDTPGHWCNALANERRGNGYEWRRHHRLHYGRPTNQAVEDLFFSYDAAGDIQCPSQDGITCYWPASLAEAEAATQPLACGEIHASRLGHNGYDTPGHWCRELALAEGNAKGFTYQWALSGLFPGPGLPDVMCASGNGIHCFQWTRLSVSFKFADPLVCGDDLALKYGGGTGHEPAWCQGGAAPEMRGHYVRIRNTSGDPVRICRTVWLDAMGRNPGYANIRCTGLAEGAAAESATAITVSPLGGHAGVRTAHQALCVETSSKAGLFLGPVSGMLAQVSIDPEGIRGDRTLLDISAGSRTCREAFATLGNL